MAIVISRFSFTALNKHFLDEVCKRNGENHLWH